MRDFLLHIKNTDRCLHSEANFVNSPTQHQDQLVMLVYNSHGDWSECVCVLLFVYNTITEAIMTLMTHRAI